MALHEHKPGHYTVQVFRKDPLGEKPLRLCKRIAGLQAAQVQQKKFEAEALAWFEQRDLIRRARASGLEVASPSQTTSATGFANFLESTYLPWARTHLDPQTLRARQGTLMILAEDIGNRRLDDVEHQVDSLVEKWRAEGCRFSATKDRLGRELKRRPRPISDAGINERLKILRAVLGYAHMRAKVLAIAPRIPLLKKKGAAPGSARPVRYFAANERVRFLRFAECDVRDVFNVNILTGLRPGELFHMKAGWIDLRRKKLTVQETLCAHCNNGTWLPKTGGYRSVDLCSDVMTIFRRLLKNKGDDALVFDNVHGTPFCRLPGSGGRYERTLRRAGLARKGLTFYSLRHSFAADLITAGWSTKDVSTLLGNSERTCQLHYSHLMPGRTAQAVKVLKAVTPWPQAPQPQSAGSVPADKDDTVAA